MPDTYKNLGQIAPTTTAETTAYTVPASTTAIISSFVIANRVSTATSFSLLNAIAGAASTNAQYLAKDTPIAGNDVIGLVLGVTMAPTDVIRFAPGTTTLSLNIYGVEKT